MVLRSEKLSSKETQKITEILKTPTEFDEFGYPKEFTLKKDSISSIFVASDDPLIYTKVISSVETRGDSILVVGSVNWMDDNAVEYEKFQTLGIALSAPYYMASDKPQYKIFERKFLLRHGRPANNISRMGYEFMLFIGNQLKTNGVYFQEGLRKAGILAGYLSEGFNYQDSRDNALVPFITFTKGELHLIEKR
jgi:hypothetical protein